MLFSDSETLERRKARQLRSECGYSVKRIAALLRVSTSSVSLRVRDIELTEEQHEALHGERRVRQRKGRVGDKRAPSRRTARSRDYGGFERPEWLDL
jgi:hypothetical protein